MKIFFETEQKTNRENFLYKTGDTKNNRVYELRKYKTMQSFESAISNVITSLENAVIDEVYLKDTIGKICKTKIPKNIDEK